MYPNINKQSSQRTLRSWTAGHDEFYQMVPYIAITGFHAPQMIVICR